MKENFVVIFPDPQLQAWDHLPRFAFLDTDLAKLTQKKEKTRERIRAPVKDSFVGAPVRSSQQVPSSRHKQQFELENEDEVFFEPAKTKTGGDAATYKGSIDF